LRYSDDELLKLVGEERKRSIGFGEGESGELTTARTRALNYSKGVMTDVPSLPGRSGVVDTTIADAIETALPDLVEIFVGGDDVATFNPVGEGDETAAQEETEFVNHVVFTENPGTVWVYTAIKDALQLRLGLLHWWFEDDEKESTREALTEDQLAVLEQQMAQEKPWAETEVEPGKDAGTFSLKIKELHGKVFVRAVPPDDFSHAQDTVILKDTTYCVMRDRPRVQDLIARGLDAEKARELPRYVSHNDTVNDARDKDGQQNSTDAIDDHRVVEVRAHYIRLMAEEGAKLAIWQIITDTEEKVLLHKEEVSHIPFGPLTPYLIQHRLIGESVADKLFEIQKIKTALWRMWLDSGYFALNQRNAVDMSKANEFTISDLLRNEPGVPVRTKGEGAVQPIQAGQLGFDPPLALEFAATVAEGRTGIVRNAQGLNPDTLHDTAKGALALMTMAQKRLRLIARMFSEMGFKDMFLGVHQLLRENCGPGHAPAMHQFGKDWKAVKPAEWSERCAMTVHVGVGSAGKEQDLMVASHRLEMMQEAVVQQGGLNGPIVDAKNMHAALEEWERAAGSRKADRFWTDPANTPPQPPKPDPEMEKVKAELQLKQQEGQATLQMKAQEGQMKASLEEQKDGRAHEREMLRIQTEGELKRYEVEQTLQLKRETTAAELEMKRELLTAELQMKREVAVMNAQVARETGMAKAQASGSVSNVEAGGEPG
jgi:hypothetical protein